MNKERSVIDYGGQGPVLQMLHANAYTPECYRKFLEPFLSRYRVLVPRQRPLQDNEDPSQLKSWKLFRDDLIGDMDQRGLKGVIGMGHSLGGIASWMAAIERPDLFSKLILIDPVIIPHRFIRGTQLLPFSLKKRYLPIVKIASKRRDKWSNLDEVRNHLGSKKLFRRFDPEVFDDFLKFGIKEKDDHLTLSFPKEWEARIYATPPNVWSIMNKTPCPIMIVKAEFSNVITQRSWQRIKKKTSNGSFLEMKQVGHLVPFERPLELARIILKELEG